MNIFNKTERDRKERRRKRKEEIRSARAYITGAIDDFADLGASFHRGELVLRRANPPFPNTCQSIIELLHQANVLASEMEGLFAPEKKERTKLFPVKKDESKPEVIDVCPQ